jgi:hypothetical protein
LYNLDELNRLQLPQVQSRETTLQPDEQVKPVLLETPPSPMVVALATSVEGMVAFWVPEGSSPESLVEEL